ncbi:MAG TPA: hypothetical protein VG937_09125 [Polyangiaceae bacterium]|jgi:hypothetical protein|nr:hypothetical protein [Polyangiaceae bacterium]
MSKEESGVSGVGPAQADSFVPRSSGTTPLAQPPRDAIVCLPGLGYGEGVSLADVGRRLAVAFDNASPSRLSFRTEAEHTRTHNGQKYQTVTLICRDGSKETPLLDLYGFDYRESLAGDLHKKAPPSQILSIALTLLLNTWTLLRAITRRSQSFSQKAQVFYGTFLFGMAFLYIVLLIGTVFLGVDQLTTGALQPAPSAAAATDETLLQHLKHNWLLVLQTGMVSVPLLGLFMQFNLKEALSKVAPTLAAATNYLSAGAHRARISGELLRLVDCLDEQTEVRYRKIHLLAYSFGSIVALDTLFPQESSPSRKMQRIDTLVTIGCPADFVRTYWPEYFERRTGFIDAPKRWLNVYAELDVLGSNFLDENPRGPDVPAGVQTLIGNQTVLRRPLETDNVRFGPAAHGRHTFLDWAGFLGFRIHSTYWDRESDHAVSCFEPLIERMFGSDPLPPAKASDSHAPTRALSSTG